MAKANQSEKLIKSKQRVKDFAEVFTPKHIVKDMCELIPDEMWQNITSTFLEPCCGNGNFLAEILERKLAICETAIDGVAALSTIYGIDIQGDNVVESRMRLYKMFYDKFGESKLAAEILRRNIVQADSLKLMKILETAEDWNDAVERYKRGDIEEQVSLF